MTAREALKSPATRNLVLKVLTMVRQHDPVDAIHDLQHVIAVLKEELNETR